MAEGAPTPPERWQGHPLQQALNGPRTVAFTVTFLVFDRATRTFVPLYDTSKGTGIIVTATTAEGELFSGKTSITGAVSFPASVKPTDSVTFTCSIDGLGLGLIGETYDDDFITPKTSLSGAASSGTFTGVYRVRKYLFKAYEDFYTFLHDDDDESLHGNSIKETDSNEKLTNNITEETMLRDNLKAFEQGYDDGHFNVLYEGDSWLHYPPNGGPNQYLFRSLDTKITASKKNTTVYAKVTLQHFGDTTLQMFAANPAALTVPSPPTETQYFHLKRCLENYRFKVIVVSGGGNDFAEPGIAVKKDHDEIRADYRDDVVALTEPPDPPGHKHPYYVRDCYDPYKASGVTDPKATPNPAAPLPGEAAFWLPRSFPALLKNHLWCLYLKGKPRESQQKESDLNGPGKVFDAILTAFYGEWGIPLAPGDPILLKLQTDEKYAREQVLEKFPAPGVPVDSAHPKVQVDFPDCLVNSAANDLLDAVFDQNHFRSRFENIKANFERLLAAVAATQDVSQVLVVAHSYCYPIFTDIPTTFWIRSKGPWLHNRLRQANVTHKFVEAAALKYCIDYFVWRVLEPLQADAKYKAFFQWVNGRDLNRDPKWWNDEIHVESKGFEKLASRLFATIDGKFGGAFKGTDQ